MILSNTINKKNNFFIKFLSFKKYIITTMFTLFILGLIFFSNSTILATKKGLNIWYNNVLPSLFPFFIATNLLNHTFIIDFISKYFNKIMRPLFNLPAEAAYALILGIISGCPIGAKIVCDLKSKNICTKEESERLLIIANNSSPLFIIGTIRNQSIFKLYYRNFTFYYSLCIFYYTRNIIRINIKIQKNK